MTRTVEDQGAGVDPLSAAALSKITGTTVLNCLGKQPCPPGLPGDLAHALDLPEAVRADLWRAVEPNLGVINTERTAAAVEAFCEQHRIDPRAITPVIGACRFLFQRGAERNTPPSLLEDDLRRLLAVRDASSPELDGVVAAILASYERAAPKLRLKAIYEALTDHGRVITDVKWRVDNVSHANTGESINVPVTLLTLRYREGEQSGQMTVQILPDELKKLLFDLQGNRGEAALGRVFERCEDVAIRVRREQPHAYERDAWRHDSVLDLRFLHLTASDGAERLELRRVDRARLAAGAACIGVEDVHDARDDLRADRCVHVVAARRIQEGFGRKPGYEHDRVADRGLAGSLDEPRDEPAHRAGFVP